MLHHLSLSSTWGYIPMSEFALTMTLGESKRQPALAIQTAAEQTRTNPLIFWDNCEGGVA